MRAHNIGSRIRRAITPNEAVHECRHPKLQTIDELCQHALVPPRAGEVAARYAVAITPAMADAIDRSDPHDPIARQFVPDARELDRRAEESADPIADDPFSPVEGVVHRYPDRVLLKVVNVCAVYCRFCFRREMVGPGRGGLSPSALAAALDYIAAHPEIWEVILSGGDPLVLSARRLKDVVAKLSTIDHVKVIRVHTRIPVVAPERINAALIRALRTDKATFVVLHVNHPRELTKQARAACARLIDAGIPMLAQSVLLRGVNDDAETLAALMRSLVECRIKPYYLHHADLAPGTAHLRTNICRRPGVDARTARPRVWSVSAGLCARHSGRPRQVADRPQLSERGRQRNGRFQRAAAHLSAAALTGQIRFCKIRCLSGGGFFERREENRGLETIAARVARPSVAHAAIVEIFGPFGSQQPGAALRANVLVVGCQTRACCRVGLQNHDFFSCPTPPITTLRATLWHLRDGIAPHP